jgi:hypothetical protein
MAAPSLPRALRLRFSRFAYDLAHLGMLRARVVGSESLGPRWDPVDGPAHRLGGRGSQYESRPLSIRDLLAVQRLTRQGRLPVWGSVPRRAS